MEKRFNSIVTNFKKNPSYASAAEAKHALWDLNNRNPFVTDNNEAPFARKYEAFQLQMEEVTVATESLGTCAGKDPALQKKVMNIGDAFAAAIAKTKPDETQTKSFQEMNTMSFANSCSIIKPGQAVTPKQLESYKNLQKALNDHSKKYAGKSESEREAMAWRERNNIKDIFDFPGKSIQEKLAAMEKEKKWEKEQLAKTKKEVAIEKNSLVKVNGFLGSEVRSHIRDKFGFVMSDNEKKQTAEKLHLSLMAGNRENALRNYTYFSQRFDFSDEEDLTQYKDSRLKDMASRQGSIMFQGQNWQGYQQLKGEDIDRLGKAGAAEIEAYKKRGKSQKLTVDDVYARLLPYLKEGGYIASEDLNKSTQPLDPKALSKTIKQIQPSASESTYSAENYYAQQAAKFQFQQQRYNKMVSNAEKGEVGFLLQSKEFDKYKNRGLTNLTKAQVMDMIKSSLKEKIQDTKDYSKNFIKKYQTTKNLWGDRGTEGLAEIGKTLVYSSPTVIYDTIAQNPKLMGSMCLPLQYAAEEKSLELPSFVKFGGGLMSAVPVGGNVASFAVGTTFGIALAAEYRYRMAGKLEGDAMVVGLGNHHTRGQEEALLDKTELKRAAKSQKDQLEKDAIDIAKTNAVGTIGGAAVARVLKSGGAGASTLSKTERLEAREIIDVVKAENAASKQIGGNASSIKGSASSSADIPFSAKNKVTLVRPNNEGGFTKFDLPTSSINAADLPADHALKKILMGLEKKGVKVVEVEGGNFHGSYLGQGKIIDAAGKEQTYEILYIQKGGLHDAAMLKNIIQHEAGHWKTFGNGGNQADFASSMTIAKNGELPYNQNVKNYENFAAGDEARQYARQGMKELRVVKESEVQQKFAISNSKELSIEEVFGQNAKGRVFQAENSFEKSANFAQMESNLYKKATASINEKSSTELIENISPGGNYKIDIKDGASVFEKELRLDPRKYPGSPQTADEIAQLQQQKTSLINQEKTQLVKDMELTPADLKDPEVVRYVNKTSAEKAQVRLVEKNPWIKTFKDDLIKDFSARRQQYTITAQKMKEASDLTRKLQGQSKISAEQYNKLRRAVSDGTTAVLPKVATP
ncbi:MAG: hypothetical protein H7235_06595 [Bdellovibrionaceae bacterium]|nr:hypothetical protein [Pseudobdellovibrionaceae bacterium]